MKRNKYHRVTASQMEPSAEVTYGEPSAEVTYKGPSCEASSYQSTLSHKNQAHEIIRQAQLPMLLQPTQFLLVAMFLLYAILHSGFAAAAPVSLDFADFKSTSGGGVEIRLSLSGKAPYPTDFTSKSPARISLDIPNTTNNLPWTLPLPIEVAGVKSVKAKQNKGRVRVDIALDKLKGYKIKRDGNDILIVIGPGGSTRRAAVSKPRAMKVAQAAPARRKPSTTRRSGSNTLRKIRFSSLPGDKVQIKLSFAKPAVAPGSFTINNPARIALDFPNTVNGLGWKSKNIGIGFAKSMTAVEAGNRTRVILNLVSLIPFDTEVSGRDVFLTLASIRSASDSGRVSNKRIATAVPGETTAHSVTNIDFRRGPNGEGRVVVTLSDASTPASSGESGQQIIVDFGNATLPQDLQQRLDVTDFATPVKYIDTTRIGKRVRLAITPQGDYEYFAYQSGSTYTVEVKKAEPKKKEDGTISDEGFSGEKLSLNFQDIEVRAVLQLIADFTDLNMVTSDSVSGNLTLRLKNVPWDQALDIVLKTKGLAQRRTGNVILVAPSAEIAAREKLELEAKKQLEKLEPLRSELIQINYAKATDLSSLLKSKGAAVMSERGQTTIDTRTNTLLVIDTSERLDAIRKLISKLDVPVRQVMIDARIVIADNTFAKDLGVRFGVTGVGNSTTLSTSAGSLEANNTVIQQGLTNPRPLTTTISPGTLSDRLNVNLPAAGNPGAIALSILGANSLLDLELSALQSEGRGEVVSNPRVVTANQQTAIIEQGTEIPFRQASSSGAATISFKKAVLGMTVTPQITPDDRVFLDLEVTKDSVGQIFAGVPSINTKSVKTQVLVSNGDTVVLGGVYEQSKSEGVTRVPFFGDLPLIGVLFRSSQKTNDKSELLIFITPKILKIGVNSTIDGK